MENVITRMLMLLSKLWRKIFHANLICKKKRLQKHKKTTYYQQNANMINKRQQLDKQNWSCNAGIYVIVTRNITKILKFDNFQMIL